MKSEVLTSATVLEAAADLGGPGGRVLLLAIAATGHASLYNDGSHDCCKHKIKWLKQRLYDFQMYV